MPEVITVPNESPEQIRTWLTDRAACTEALAWSAGKSLAEIWETCEEPDWMYWLAFYKTATKRCFGGTPLPVDPNWGSSINCEFVSQEVYGAGRSIRCDVFRKYYVIQD